MLPPFTNEGGYMNQVLKRELAYLTALLAFTGRKWFSKSQLAMFGGMAIGLYMASRVKTYNFYGKTAYITGGSRGLGLSLAWNLLERGADVVLVARDLKELEVAEKTLRRDYPDAEIYLSVCDITDKNDLRKSFYEAAADLDGIDILINNAGSTIVGPFAAMDREDFEAQMNVHFYAAIESTRIAREHFIARGGGHIINICALGGKTGLPHMSAYDASKFALAGFSQGVQAELARDGIQVTTVFPFLVRTGSPIQTVFKGDHEKEFKIYAALESLPFVSMSADEAAKKILDALALGQTEVVLSSLGQIRIVLGALLPELTGVATELAARVLPYDLSKERRTGAEIAGHRRRTKEEKMYNQIPRHDAKFNLGLPADPTP